MTNPILTRLDALKRLADAATPVVVWYPHPEDATVRGPYHRWFKCLEPEGEHVIESGKYAGTKVRADMRDDVRYAAEAMTALPQLVEALRVAVDALSDAKWAERLLNRPQQCEHAITLIQEILQCRE